MYTDFFQFLVMKGKGLWFISKSRFLYCNLQHFHNYYKVQSSGRKEKEMDLKRKATVEGSRNKKAK